MEFTGKAVIVTGASSGIGQALAVEFARRGARVGLVARREDRLAKLCQEIRSSGATASFAVADAADRLKVAEAIRRLTAELGPCDVMVANAGVGASNTARDLNLADAERAIQTNLLGPMYAFDTVVGGMVERGHGHLVGISSVAALKGLPTAAAYSASKAGLNAYLESLRISLRPHGVAVTAICPGFVRTEMTETNPRMIWVLEADRAAKKIAGAIARRKKVYSFPWRMRALIELTRWLPDGLVARAFADSR